MITVASLSHRFEGSGEAALPVLDNIDLTVEPGEFVALVGPSGCGKTTLLNIVAGLEKHSGSGEVTLNGQIPRAGNPEVGYMLARDCLLPWRRALDNAALGLQLRGMPKRERSDRAREALQNLGLSDFEASYPAQLSQGMRQRVALARLFVTDPAVILLDEPFSALDAQTRLTVQDAFLRVWERRRTTVVLVTHDLTEAVALADRVVIMSRRPGRIKAIHCIDLPRPRIASSTRSHPQFQHFYNVTWEDLKEEVLGADGAPDEAPSYLREEVEA